MNKEQKPEATYDIFFTYSEIISWLVLFSAALLIFLIEESVQERITSGVLIFIGAVYLIVLFRILAKRVRNKHPLEVAAVVINVLILSLLDYVLRPIHIPVDTIFVIIPVSVGIFSPIRVVVFSIFFAWLGVSSIGFLTEGFSSSFVVSSGIHLFVFTSMGFLSYFLSQTIRQQLSQLSLKNEILNVLLESSRIAATSSKPELLIPQITRSLKESYSAAFCCVSLLTNDKSTILTCHSFSEDSGANVNDEVTKFSIEKIKPLQEVIHAKTAVVIKRYDPSLDKQSLEFFKPWLEKAEIIATLPLLSENQVLGFLSIGDSSHWENHHISDAQMNTLTDVANQVALVVSNAELYTASETQAERVSVLNNIARSISKTIELDELLELIFQELMKILQADSYFISLYNPEQNLLDFRVLYDAGKRYPRKMIPVGEGLSSWVIEHKKPLRVRDLPEEIQSLGLSPVIVGEGKISHSWLGVPMLAGVHLVGLVAVASYDKNAFSEEDEDLLVNIAGQAALAIDNAHHHAEVEEQARRDSLTGVFNHSYFIKQVHAEFAQALINNHPLSMIMLDIDHFKKYNDKYGHLVGDEVLMLIVQAISRHVKSTDSVGRWGGEEFGVLLPNANTQQAKMVAERIRSTLAELPLLDKEKRSIPKPTVSQGIANFPEHVSSAGHLIDKADQALLKAKKRGRDQVLVISEVTTRKKTS